ncbi:MAG: PEGA domain-containing protein [Polyangia bacterium]
MRETHHRLRALPPISALVLAALLPLVSFEARAQDARTAAAKSAKADPSLDARALELAGFRSLATLAISSTPIGAEVRIGEHLCYTPCRLSLPPGHAAVRIDHPDREPEELDVELHGAEQLRVHARLGRPAPHEIIVPLYFVGTVFTAGGISSVALNADVDPRPVGGSSGDAESRLFHRNLGIASIAVGVPLLGLATYLLATGRPGEVFTSTGPGISNLSLGPAFDERGRLSGAGLAAAF